MEKIKIIMAGAVGGIICGIICLAIVLSAVTAAREGPGAGLAVLVVSPIYLFLYIVAFFNTLLPAGVITGAVAGLGEAFLPRPLNMVLTSLSGIISGGFFGFRFTDIFLESRDTRMDLIVGAIAAGIVLGVAGVLISTILKRIVSKSNR